MVPAGGPRHHRSSPVQEGGVTRRGRQSRVGIPASQPCQWLSQIQAEACTGLQTGTAAPCHAVPCALSTRAEAELSAGEARARPSPHPHEPSRHTPAHGGDSQPGPRLRTEQEITGSAGAGSQDHAGSVQRGEGQCPDRASRTEKPSSAQGQQCCRRLAHRGPDPRPQPGTPPPRPPPMALPACLICFGVGPNIPPPPVSL